MIKDKQRQSSREAVKFGTKPFFQISGSTGPVKVDPAVQNPNYSSNTTVATRNDGIIKKTSSHGAFGKDKRPSSSTRKNN